VDARENNSSFFLKCTGPLKQVLLSTERIRWEFARCDRFSRQATLFPLAPNVPVKVSTFADDMGGCLADRRFFLFIVGLFAAVALILAAVGLYGVVAFYVALRTQEIGFRIALGARRSDVLRLVLGQGSPMAVLGVVVRIGAALAISRLISSLLFGISTTAPLTFADVALLVSLIALAASYIPIPARRAMRVDPVKSVTLRMIFPRCPRTAVRPHPSGCVITNPEVHEDGASICAKLSMHSSRDRGKRNL